MVHHRWSDRGLSRQVIIGIVSMIIAAAISGGWLAFIIGVVIAVILVALVSRFMAGRGGRPVRA
jgi:asparagine N-glycosylation enzyme membrane subunit Stt3